MVLNFKTNQKKRGLQTTSLIWALWSHQVILLIRFVTDYLLKNIRLFKPRANSCLWSQRSKAWTNLNLPQLKKLWQNLLMLNLFPYYHIPLKRGLTFLFNKLESKVFFGFFKVKFCETGYVVLKKIKKINNNTDNFDHLHPVKSLAQMNFLEKSISWCYLKKRPCLPSILLYNKVCHWRVLVQQ